MALTIGQIAAVSYNAVLNEARLPANQWESSGFMHELERQGGIEKKSLGAQIEATLDYRRNPGTVIQATDLQPVVTSKTEVITAAVYDIAEVTVPVTWSKKDEVQTPTENAKVNFVKSLLTNGFNSHDDILEQSFFATSQSASEQVPPQADAAFAATVQTRISFARVFGGARETLHQAFVGRVERASDAAITYSQ